MATGTTAEQIIDVVTPAAGESVTEGTILEWHVKVGDAIKLDDTIVEISTDKVDVELPSPASGTVVEILAREGETETVGQVIARLSANGAAPSEAASEATMEPAPAGGASTGDTDGKRVSPVAAGVATVEGVDLSGVAGSGPAGLIVKADVLEAAGNGAQAAGVAVANGEAGATAEEPAGGGRQAAAQPREG